MKLANTPSEVPIENCEMHTLISSMRMNIDKDIHGLAESIKHHGLMQAGRAVKSPKGKVQIYIGARRLVACRLRKRKTYAVYVDEDLKDEEIISRSLGENATEGQEKLGVRLTEELHYFSTLASKHYSRDQIDEIARAGGMKKDQLSKKFKLLDFLTTQDLEGLYKVEEKTDFIYDLSLLMGIWPFCDNDKPTFLGACASAAAKKDWTVKGLNVDLVQGSAAEAPKIPWFKKIFPDLDIKQEKNAHAVAEYLMNALNSNSSDPNNRYFYKACTKCGFEIPLVCELKSKGNPHATTYKFREDGRFPGERITLDRILIGRIQCGSCGSHRKLVLKPLGNEKMRVKLEEATDVDEEEEEDSRDVIESAVTKFSPKFNQFIIIDQGKNYLYDVELGRRRPMSDKEFEEHKEYLRRLNGSQTNGQLKGSAGTVLSR